MELITGYTNEQRSCIQPFVESAIDVIAKFSKVEALPVGGYVKTDGYTWGDITGIIAVSGDKATGSMMISFQQSIILSVVSNMFAMEYKAIDRDVIDAVGEVTNIVCGSAKKGLIDMGLSVHMASPTVVVGKGVLVGVSGPHEVFAIQCDSSVGSFVVETNLVKPL